MKPRSNPPNSGQQQHTTALPQGYGPQGQSAPRKVGRYELFGEIASGGMASVHLGRMSGQAGFSKTVAIKRPHPHLASNPEFARMIVDEARLAARIQHPNVVATLDVVANAGELFLVMDYVHGESLWHLLAAASARGLRVPPAIVGSIIVNVLHGLHAAHEATDEQGRPLGIVHRDVSPQNVLVGVDGVARVLDFGVAKATGRLQTTNEGQLKGKFAYMAPEQVSGAPIDRRTDIYAASALLWGALAGRRLIEGRSEAELLNNVLQCKHLFPSSYAPEITPEMDAAVMRGLSLHPDDRYQSAREMAIAIEAAIGMVSPFQVGEWVKSLAAEAISLRSSRIRDMESASDVRISMHQGVAEIVQGGNTYDVHHYPAGSNPRGTLQMGPPPSVLGNQPTAVLSPSQTPPPPFHNGPTTAGLYFSAGAEPLPEPRGRSIASLIGVAALVFAVTFGGTLYWRYGARVGEGGEPARQAPTQEAPPPPPTVAPIVGAAPSTSPTAAPTVAIATTPTPSVATAATTATTATATTPSARPTASATIKPVVRPKKKADCEANPFFVDAEGIKRARPECM